MAERFSEDPDLRPDYREQLWDLVNLLEDELRFGMTGTSHPELPAAPAAPAQRTPAADRAAAPPGTGAGTEASAPGTAAKSRTAAAPGTGSMAGSNASGHPAAAMSPIDGANLAQLAEAVAACTLCGLSTGRSRAVPGEGDATNASVMIIGEAPGAEEDIQGRPFVGPAGQYLDKWLEAIGLSRSNGVYITNTVKCRPPSNRDPQPQEAAACRPYLLRQIALVRPRIILCVGRISAGLLLGREVKMGEIRGQWFEYSGIPLMATYHPSAVLRNPDLRRPVWEDMKILRQALDEGQAR